LLKPLYDLYNKRVDT